MATVMSESRVINESLNSVDSVQWTNCDSISHVVAEDVISMKSGKGDADGGQNLTNSLSEVMFNMDEDLIAGQVINQGVNSVYQNSSEITSDSSDPGSRETVIVINSDAGNVVGVIRDNEVLSHSKGKLNMHEDLNDVEGTSASIHSVISGSSSSKNLIKSVEQGVEESATGIRSTKGSAACTSAENRHVIPSELKKNEASDLKKNEAGLGKESLNALKVKDLKDENSLCVINIKCGGAGGNFGENSDCERVCRICHLGYDQPSESSVIKTTCSNNLILIDMIHLGCGCKDDLGMAHSHCAEAWFKLKGNRLCEICGESAKNVTGVRDNRFMEVWNDRTSSINGTNILERNGGCCRRQPFCNFLMACLVIAFVLPWFFRVNMF